MARRSHNRDYYSLVCYSSMTHESASMWLNLRKHFLTNKGREFVAKRGKALLNIANLLRAGNAQWKTRGVRRRIPVPIKGKPGRFYFTYPPKETVVFVDPSTKEKVLEVAKDARISLSSALLPQGVEGEVVRKYVLAKKGQAIRRQAAVLRGYTDIFLKSTSRSQFDKCNHSINDAPSLSREDWDKHSIIFRNGVYWDSDRYPIAVLPLRKGSCEFKPQLPSLSDLSGTSAYPYDLTFYNGKPTSFMSKPFAKMVASLLSKGFVPDSLRNLYPTWDSALGMVSQGDENIHVQDIALHNHKAKWYSWSNAHGYNVSNLGPEQAQVWLDHPDLGKINIIQEGGAKGRVVCTPNAWIQYFMYPIHHHLASIVKQLEDPHSFSYLRLHGTSCMYNQARGVYKTLAALGNGKKVWSVDLSSATDRFPLELQIRLLDYLGMPELSQVYRDLRGPYWGLDGQPWFYRAGQPMGLYSSFPLFHLTHLAVLEACCQYVMQRRLPEPTLDPITGDSKYRSVSENTHDMYAVIGDDVLISDEDVLKRYLFVLGKLGVPVQPTKCFDTHLAEFAGFLIVEKNNNSFDRERFVAFRPLKYKGPENPLPILALCHSIGSRIRKWGHKYAKAYDAYEATMSERDITLAPLLSEEKDFTFGDCKPGSKYFGSLINQLAYFSNLSSFTISPEQSQVLIEGWYNDRFMLLKEDKSYGRTSYGPLNNVFDPKQYELQDRTSKLRFNPLLAQGLNPWRSFAADPLVSEYCRLHRKVESE